MHKFLQKSMNFVCYLTNLNRISMRVLSILPNLHELKIGILLAFKNLLAIVELLKFQDLIYNIHFFFYYFIILNKHYKSFTFYK